MYNARADMMIAPVGTSLSANDAGPITGQSTGWWFGVLNNGGGLYRENTIGIGSGRLPNLVEPNPDPFRASQNRPVRRPRVAHIPTLAEIGGARCANLLSAWDTLVANPFAAFPSKRRSVWFEGNINDVRHSTDMSDFRDQVRELMNRAAAYGPFLWLGALLGYVDPPEIGFPVAPGEQWSAFGDSFNLAIDDYNANVADVASEFGPVATYIDGRTPFQEWEIANNPGDAGSGLLTTDGVHLSDVLGQGLVKEVALRQIRWNH